MDKAAIVSIDTSRGADIAGILDRAKVKVVVAIWVYLSEYEDWRLVLASRQFDSSGFIHVMAYFTNDLLPEVMGSQSPALRGCAWVARGLANAL